MKGTNWFIGRVHQNAGNVSATQNIMGKDPQTSCLICIHGHWICCLIFWSWQPWEQYLLTNSWWESKDSCPSCLILAHKSRLLWLSIGTKNMWSHVVVTQAPVHWVELTSSYCDSTEENMHVSFRDVCEAFSVCFPMLNAKNNNSIKTSKRGILFYERRS